MMAAAANCFNFAGIANNASPSCHLPLPPTSTIDDIPNDPGKMFIGGLSWQTTPESIREYFSSFGELAEVMVMKDPATRRSRGFGFITFSDPRSVEDVLKYPVHQLDGKLVEPKVAVPRKTNPKLVMRTRKIFVGGLSATTSLEDIKAYFEQFSPVKEAMLAYDKITSRHRGFGFVTFDNEDVVDKICEIHFHEINGKMVESKKALPKEPRLAYYSNDYGSPSASGAPATLGYGPHFSPTTARHHGNPFGTYGGGGGGGGGGGQRYSQSYGHQYGYDHHHRNDQQQQQQQDRQFLQMGGGGQFDNVNFGYDGGCDDVRYYSGNKYGGGGSSSLQQRQYGYGRGNLDYGTVGGSRVNENSPFSYRDGGGVGRTYERVRSVANGNHGGGSFGLSNGYYSSSRDCGNNYSTSAGSSGGGSGENSAGYEDDFPELATAKFNSLRLDDDVSSPTTAAHNDMNQNHLVGGGGGVGSSAFAAF